MPRRKRRVLPGSSPEKCPEDIFRDFDSIPFQLITKPINIEDNELYMNKNKLSQLDDWLVSVKNKNSTKSILVLSGPTGTGKSFTIRTLAKRHRIMLKDYFTHEVPHIKSVSQSKYSALCFESDGEFSAETSILFFDDFCYSMLRSGLLSKLLSLNQAMIFVVTEPVTQEPSLVIWLKEILSSEKSHHIQ